MRSRADGIARDAVRAYLMRHRKWDSPLLSYDETFDLGGPIDKDVIRTMMNRPA
ncbi:hypothetical protein OH799_28230 [Nocardia sp. NBC_00881]|uniref:hypothetical protein n=1 Tax=Nocardia sp. NBC_00881 TaxID=2975995 RepID=UPI00386A5D9E|nr:hypothetical protein OH799_28230 [Nocardia sp. NBC_00881]